MLARMPPAALTSQASRYRVPIYITETGIADRSDTKRAHMIDTYMQAVRRPARAPTTGLFGLPCIMVSAPCAAPPLHP